MTKKRKDVSENLLEALRQLPNPIEDRKHGLTIYFDDNRSRSNEARFEHIAGMRHELTVKDIESIPRGIKNAVICKDGRRKKTWFLYFPRKGQNGGLIKICLQLDRKNPRLAKVKTIFLTR